MQDFAGVPKSPETKLDFSIPEDDHEAEPADKAELKRQGVIDLDEEDDRVPRESAFERAEREAEMADFIEGPLGDEDRRSPVGKA